MSTCNPAKRGGCAIRHARSVPRATVRGGSDNPKPRRQETSSSTSDASTYRGAVSFNPQITYPRQSVLHDRFLPQSGEPPPVACSRDRGSRNRAVTPARADTSQIAIAQPSATNCRTSSRPIPEPRPVTTAILPQNPFIGLPPLRSHCRQNGSGRALRVL